MTKTLAALAAVTCLLLATPAVQAHGAAAAREIDTRLLADDEGAIPYGGCAEGTCLPGLEAEALDLVVLEVREAYLNSAPALVFRIVYQTDDTHEGRSVDLIFTAAGKEHTYNFATDGVVAPTGSFDKLSGPFEAFDGYPRAVDAYLLYDTLGVKPGDEVTDIHLASNFEGEANDALPGTWFASGQEMPYIPNVVEEGELAQPDPATYKLQGPAPLVNITVTRVGTEVTLTVKNPLAATPQFVSFTGTGVSFDNANLNLEAGATREVKVTITDASLAHVNASSDLDYFEAIPLASTAPPSTSTTSTHSTTHSPPAASTSQSSTHADGEDHDETSKDTPSLPTAGLTIAVLGVAMILRRRALT